MFIFVYIMRTVVSNNAKTLASISNMLNDLQKLVKRVLKYNNFM